MMRESKSSPLNLQRRAFLKLSGLVGLGVAGVSALPLIKDDALLFSRKEFKVTTTRLAMGTFVRITAIHSSRDQAENAIGRTFEEMERLTSVLSRFEKSSPLTELNETGKVETAGTPVFRELVAKSVYYNHITGGAFDITVKPLIELYASSFAKGLEPHLETVEKVLERIGTEHIRFQNNSIMFGRENMGITLDGIAKGYIVDSASRLLREKGINNHLINAGGDIRTSGKTTGNKPWTIAIQDPDDRGGHRGLVHMNNGALATSGNYEVYYDREKIFHHIIDGRTGYSPPGYSSVTVQAQNVMEADALSTSIFVMPPDQGVALISRLPQCECFCIEKNNFPLQSSGWQFAA